jgi:hypothetical protein
MQHRRPPSSTGSALPAGKTLRHLRAFPTPASAPAAHLRPLLGGDLLCPSRRCHPARSTGPCPPSAAAPMQPQVTPRVTPAAQPRVAVPRSAKPLVRARREGFEPPTARSVAWCSASIRSAPGGSRRIVWMIKQMIKRRDAETSDAAQATGHRWSGYQTLHLVTPGGTACHLRTGGVQVRLGTRGSSGRCR